MKNIKLTYENNYKKVYESEGVNKKGEKIIFELSKCYYDNKNKNSLPKLWKKNGYTNHLYNSVIWADCEVIDKEGNCRRKYEPTTKESEDGKRLVINFDWMLEVSEENEKIIFDEIIKRWKEAK